MGGAEGVVDVGVGHARPAFRRRRDRWPPLRCSSGRFPKGAAARLEARRRRRPTLSPMQSSTNATGQPSISARSAATGRRDMEGSRLPLGRPRWAARMILAPLADEEAQGGEGFLDAGAVVDDHFAIPLFHRHIVIHADENPFLGHIQIIYSQFCHKKVEDTPRRGGVKRNGVSGEAFNLANIEDSGGAWGEMRNAKCKMMNGR